MARKPDAKRKPGISGPKNLLKKAAIAGLIMGVIVSWCLVLLIWAGKTEEGTSAGAESFTRELDAYDSFDAPKRALEGENPNEIERRLSRLQRQARGAEDQLSVLKRGRALALIDRRYISVYSKLAREAAEKYAYSAPVAAVAAEAVLLDDITSEEALALLKDYALRLSQYRFSLLELSVHILAGNLDNPALAAAVPGLESLLSQDLSSLPMEAGKALLIDDFLLRAVKGDISGASFRLNTLLSTVPEIMPMGAEFHYDHNNPLKSAELFLSLAGEKNHAMAADALVLAGEPRGARNIWYALSSGDPSSETIMRSLYNLASSAGNPAEELLWLEKMFSMQSQSRRVGDITNTYGTIRYARLDTARGIEILQEAGMSQNPLFDLELLRLKLDTLPPRRAAAEVWLLLGRHPEDEELHEWAAWYFDYQKLFDETARVTREAARRGMRGVWLDLHRSLAFLRDGRIADGEKILREAMVSGRGKSDWRIPANLGRVQEGRRAISSALEFYESAAALVKERTSAAQVQMRISRCLEALGRNAESHRALEYALELDPDNLFIRRELRY